MPRHPDVAVTPDPTRPGDRADATLIAEPGQEQRDEQNDRGHTGDPIGQRPACGVELVCRHGRPVMQRRPAGQSRCRRGRRRSRGAHGRSGLGRRGAGAQRGAAARAGGGIIGGYVLALRAGLRHDAPPSFGRRESAYPRTLSNHGLVQAPRVYGGATPVTRDHPSDAWPAPGYTPPSATWCGALFLGCRPIGSGGRRVPLGLEQREPGHRVPAHGDAPRSRRAGHGRQRDGGVGRLGRPERQAAVDALGHGARCRQRAARTTRSRPWRTAWRRDTPTP